VHAGSGVRAFARAAKLASKTAAEAAGDGQVLYERDGRTPPFSKKKRGLSASLDHVAA